MKTLTILGARPQFIKASPVIKLLRNDVLVHTGQHYDGNMSRVFFDELDIPEPKYNLNVNGGSNNYQVTTMMQKLEPIIKKERPDTIIVYGDTNSTLAGAVISKSMDIRLAHVEAGLRSFNMDMPEERNRTITDKLADILLCPTEIAYDNLVAESLHPKATISGDTMYDVIVANSFFQNVAMLTKWNLRQKEYYVATLHRPQNVDNAHKLEIIMDALGGLDKPVLFPCHPRTQKNLNGICLNSNIILIDPLGYMDMMTLVANASRVITDSGGLQKEAHMLEVPCVTVRPETEWLETVNCGANKLCDVNKADIIEAVKSDFDLVNIYPYGDGDAALSIVESIYADIHC